VSLGEAYLAAEPKGGHAVRQVCHHVLGRGSVRAVVALGVGAVGPRASHDADTAHLQDEQTSTDRADATACAAQ
jgi:hypothetical protein